MNIILIGIQGSGKGTQAKLLSDRFGWKHVTSGDLFRKNIEQRTKLGIVVKKYIDAGELVPDKYVLEMISDALNNAPDGFILDGFPRNIEQVLFLVDNFKIDYAILLELSDEKAIERLMARRNCKICKKDYNVLFKKPKVPGICDECGGELVQRDDDNKDAISKRIEKFHNETNKVIDFFKQKDMLIQVNADLPLQAIHEDIASRLKGK